MARLIANVKQSSERPGPGAPRGTDDEQLGVRTLNDIQAADDPYDKSEWAGQGGVPARTSAGRPGMPKWLIGGDFVGRRPVADISDLVYESEAKYASAG